MMRSFVSAISFLSLCACQNGITQTEAILADASPETIEALKASLGEAMGRSMIELGASDPTQQSSVSVLPLPLSQRDDRSLERPTTFDLVLIESVCYAINRDTGRETRLADVPCRAL